MTKNNESADPRNQENLIESLLGQDGIERRYIPAEFRADEEGIIEGYAAVFDQWSEDLGFFREKIRQGAFAKTIKEADIRALFNHDPNYVLGRNRAATLELGEDDHGLEMKITPPDTSYANDLRESIDRGDIDQASFGFATIRDEWNHESEPPERELIELRLYDVSVVTYPAYTQTSVSARTLAEMFVARVQHTGNFDEVRLMMDQFEEIFAASTPGQGSHLDADQADQDLQRARNAIRKRRLQLERLNLI